MQRIFTLFIISMAVSMPVWAQTQPAQPLTGYGGSTYPYDSVITINADDGPTGFMLYIPTSPHADSLPIVIFNHGYSAWNPMSYGGWINHIVRRGSIVIFPMYQKSELTSPALFTPNADTGVLRAIDTLHAHADYTQPMLNKLCIVGHSYGGVVTANMGEDYAAYGLPKPAAIMGAAPGYGTAPQGALPTYSNMDSSINILAIFEEDDDVVDSVFALIMFDSTTAVPYSHKNLIVHHPDSTGTPPCGSSHGQSCSVDSAYDNGDTGPVIYLANATSVTDAVDFYCYWKLFDALQDCALNGNGCTTAFGDTYAQKYAGTWSNSVPIVPLEVRPAVVVTGVKEMQTGFQYMYPNPADKLLTIGPLDNISLISIVNVLGEEVLTQKTDSGANPVSINVSGLPCGIYCIRLVAAGQILRVEKLVVSR